MKYPNDARIKISHATNRIESCYEHITKKDVTSVQQNIANNEVAE